MEQQRDPNYPSRRTELTLAAGPADIDPRVSAAMTNPIRYHYDPEFLALHRAVEEKLKSVFRTENDMIIMHGEAILGLEAAAHACIAPGTRCLNLVTGVFGKWFEDFILAAGGEVVELAKEYNQAISAEEVRRAFEENPGIEVMTVVHSETPSGTVNPIGELCPVAKEHGAVTIVDSVSGVGGSEMRVDEWGVDLCLVGPQKCLGAAPGLSLISVSRDGYERMRAAAAPRGTFLSILDWKEKWIDGGAFPYTPSVSLIYGLDAALDLVLEEGIDNAVARHERCAAACRAGITGMGLDLWPETEEIAAACATAFHLPRGVDSDEFRERMRRESGILIAPGYGELRSKLLRIGHMGHTAKPMYVVSALAFVGTTMQSFGIDVSIGSGVEAALAAL